MPETTIHLNEEGRQIKRSSFYREIRKAVHKQAKQQGGDIHDSTGVVDLLANVMHICDESDLDFADCERQARNHYLAELEVSTDA